ncbi:chemotaxis protein CheA [Alteromonas gracilis]|uniref:chemotaxis protein CheA n=1 Tax=Alteromonas gracilis TaxID=1479524 RepID=UPI003736359C
MMNLIDTFLEEAEEHLAAMEAALLELEENDVSDDIINTVFRAIHTIKGSAGMVGLDHVSYFAHHVESFLDALRAHQVSYKPDMVAVLIESRDHIDTLIHSHVSNELMAVSEQIIAKVKTWYSDTSSEEVSSSDVTVEGSNDEGYWKLQFTPHAETFKDGFDVLPIIRELSELGECVVSTSLNPRENLEFEPTMCQLSFVVLLDGNIDEASVMSAFMFVEDEWQIECDFHSLEESSRLGDILVSMGAAEESTIEDTLADKPKVGELLTERGVVSERDVKQALDQQSFVETKQVQSAKKQANVKVSADKLDKLLDLVGELVIVQSAVNQHAENQSDLYLTNIGEELSRLTTEIRDTTFGIRMLPVGSTFARYRRLIRDLSQSLDKKVQLVTKGADTEVDKMVLENLNDPLIHLLRNSMDHGIETPQVRLDAGKEETGTILLEASHRNGKVSIVIKDDGAGLCTKKIKEKALKNRLIQPDDVLSDHDIHQLIFAPGFSTASEVSDVSGRGVGMDVVKTSIENMQGSLILHSEEGKGTSTEILLPLTLAIIDGLMVNVANEIFIIPLSTIEECVEINQPKSRREDGALLVKTRGELVPAISLRSHFSIRGDFPPYPQCVIVNSTESRFGIMVDSVIGQHQTVIKSLGKLYHNVRGLMGSTILGNGDVAMIIDTTQLFEDVILPRQENSFTEKSYVDEN